MAKTAVTTNALPTNRNVGIMRGAIMELTEAYCLKLVPKSPWSKSPSQMRYWTGKG